ncbi:hypothetical protein PVL29_001858 [Vitis rotundifolia]|uniref:(S)-N-methylcoclaurine 3'-hydroxylase isozyme 2 n=2 Tax=Vitis rotundifolia TaxID=103349 RepID=A0AA39AGH9_VITRO|nr:hypothetical protein PVL29_001858 [Vitis rotundifolia]
MVAMIAEGNSFFNVLLPILLLLPLVFLILKLLKDSSSLKSPPLPPGPSPWPILGNLLHLGNMPHISLARFSQSYGPLISLRLGSQILVVASSSSAAVEILKTHDRVLSGRYVPHAVPAKKSEINPMSLGWAVECNGAWKNLRTACRAELFSTKVMESQAWVGEKKVMEMVRFVSTKEGEAVKVGEVVFATVLNTMTTILMSRDFISFEDDNKDGGMKGLVRKMLMAMAAPNLDDFYPIFSGLDLQGLNKKTKELIARICSMWESVIRERREGASDDPSKQDFLNILIRSGYSDDQINQLFLELLAAGADTSSSTLEWAMAELIKSPESMKKVHEELAREISDNLLKASDLPHLPYLQACVKETLRLHPPVPLLLPRRASVSCEVMNYTIPKDSQIWVNAWAIGRDPMIWEDPLVFKPERFLNSAVDFKGNNLEFIPFGAGRRICPGLPMAARLLPLILASLTHFFDWSLPNGTTPDELDMNDKFGVTLQKELPLLIIPKVRKLSREALHFH